MDADDLFAELDALSSSAVKASTTTTTSSSAPNTQTISNSLDDEFFELLNSTSTITPIKSDSTTANSTSVPPAVKPTPTNLTNDEDFLSWLEETPKRSGSNDINQVINSVPKTETISISHADTAAVDPINVPITSSSSTEVISNETKPTSSVDAFLNDVFGSSDHVAQHIEKASEKKKQDDLKKSEYEQDLENIVDSPFPDLGALRLALDQGGYVPSRLRGKVLILLLTGRTQLDDEALNFTASADEKQFFIDLLPDCEALIRQEGNYENPKLLADVISDVVYLYCQRRNVEYKNVFSRIMLSILGRNENTTKPLLSSCFYSLAANFLPLVGLQYTSLDLATDAVHFWLRLLVTYHCPALAQHLDRVLPGWEKCSKELCTTPHQAAKLNELIKGSNKLDLLEKQFGINLDYDFDQELSTDNSNNINSASPTPAKGAAVESAPPKLNRKGMISTHWIISFFSGCIPASESAKLLDWSVFNGERFAGLYFLTSLLDLYSDLLLTLNGNQIATWFENIERNKEDWYKDCTFSIPADKDEKKGQFETKDLTWAQFTNGWIKATANLICTTPQAFRESLPRTETWAILAAERQSKSLSTQFKNLLSIEKKKMKGGKSSLDEQIHGAIVEDKIFDDNESDSASDSGDEAANEEETEGNTADQSKSRVSTLFGRLRAVANRFQEDSLDASFDDNGDLSFAQDQKLTGDTICLWSSVEEVVPCICSNTRRRADNRTPRDVFYEFFTSSTTSSTETNQSCFFLAPLDNFTPLYFAIDCRRLVEKTMGLFPKAYSLDPDVIYDGEGLNELLTVLEPISATTHICIIGSGADFYKWQLSLRYQKKTKRWKKELKELIEEDLKRVNALAMILIKKSFKYISVLQGGFYDAVHYVNKPESKLTLNTAIVDADRFRISSMLGLTVDAPVNKPTLTSSLATALNETAPAALKSVGSLISNWRQSATTRPTSASTTSTSSSDPPPAPEKQSETAHAAPVSTNANNNDTPVEQSAASNAPNSAPTVTAAKQIFSALGMFGASSLDTIKKGISAVAEKAAAPATTQKVEKKATEHDDYPFDDGLGPREVPTNKISITKSDEERAHALALHRMSGLRKGDQITISRAELPGAILFPCTKIKEILVSSDNAKTANNHHEKEAAPSQPFEVGVANSQDEQEEEEKEKPVADDEKHKPVKKEIVVSRYLAVSRERFMVLDANGGGVGSIATVKSNHHLTELAKMTFKKKDPEMVTLFILGDDGNMKQRAYRVTKYKDFISTLQKNMERFN